MINVIVTIFSKVTLKMSLGEAPWIKGLLCINEDLSSDSLTSLKFGCGSYSMSVISALPRRDVRQGQENP